MEQKSFFNLKPNLITIWLLVQFLVATVRSSPVLFERDILIDQDSKAIVNGLINGKADDIKRTKRGATDDASDLWDFGVIPYVFDHEVGFSEDQINRMKEAMREWQKFTCIKFVERNESEHIQFIRFTKKDCGCCSSVGKNWYHPYGQDVSIGDGCHYKGTILHELGHAIGFQHEHQRPDRDDYVEIRTEFIEDDKYSIMANFDKKKLEVNSLGEPYDYDSIMHYNSYAFSKDPKDPKMLTILPKTGPIDRIGQRSGLSPGDIRQTNKLYKCPSCGGTLIDQQGVFISPNYHTKSGDLFQCEWRILAKDKERIRLNITEMDIFHSIDCYSSYLEIRDGYWHKSKLLGRLCGSNNNTQVFESNGNRMVINYFSNQPDHRGFAANYLSNLVRHHGFPNLF